MQTIKSHTFEDGQKAFPLQNDSIATTVFQIFEAVHPWQYGKKKKERQDSLSTLLLSIIRFEAPYKYAYL